MHGYVISGRKNDGNVQISKFVTPDPLWRHRTLNLPPKVLKSHLKPNKIRWNDCLHLRIDMVMVFWMEKIIVMLKYQNSKFVTSVMTSQTLNLPKIHLKRNKSQSNYCFLLRISTGMFLKVRKPMVIIESQNSKTLTCFVTSRSPKFTPK